MASNARTGFRSTVLRILPPVLFTIVLACHALAAPYNGETFTYSQPGGATFQVRLWGDEFFAYQETLDGYLVIRDDVSGFFCYARVTPDGTDIVSTGIRVGARVPPRLARKQRLRSGAAFEKSRRLRGLLRCDEKGRSIETPTTKAPPGSTTTGTRIGLVLLASFPDRQEDVTITRAQVDAYCNDDDYTDFGNATSVKGYFSEQSDGTLTYNLTVAAYFTATNNRAYYMDPNISYGTRARELIKEGLAVLDAEGFDFSQCDANSDSVIDGVNCFYAGARTNSWAEGLWPHKSSTSWSGFTSHGLATGFQYQITDLPNDLKLGTFCHENGHMLCGFPDLYSYDGNAARISSFSLMASSGSSHPVNVDPYLKLHAGWADIVDIDSSSHQLCAVQEDRNYFYRYRNPDDSQEYFLFEVRNNSGYEGPTGGASGSVNPSAGLVVYHALETGRNTSSSIFTANNPTNDYSTPYELLVVEANPSAAVTPWYDDPTPGSDDAFHAGGSNELSDSTSPALKFWDSTGRGSNSACHVHSVSAISTSMTFIVGTGALSGPPAIGLTVTELNPVTEYGTDAASQTFGVYNSNAGTLSYTVSNNAAWLSVAPASGTASNETDLLVVTYDTDALSSGSYTGTVTITDAGASNSPQAFDVTLTVEDEPGIELTTNAVSVTLAPGTGTNEYFEVRNAGGGTLVYTLSESLYWLSLDSTGGSVAAESDRIAVTFGDRVPSGTYTGTITVASSNATNSPKTVSASLTVTGSVNLFLETPDGGEDLYTGESTDITWNVSPTVTGNMQIDLLEGGSVLTNIVASTANDGLYSWTIPGTLGGDTFRVRITNLDNGSVTDDSDADFSINTKLHDENMDTDPGYAVSNGEWEYGDPVDNAYGGPTTAYTGTNIYDTNLDGAAFNTTYLTTPVIDCSGHENVSLTFAGEFSVYTGFAAVVQITTNGSTWSNLFYVKNNNDSGWQFHSYDLSSTADGEANVQVRWGHVREPGGANWSGMGIDDVLMVGTYAEPAPPSLPAPIATAATNITSSSFFANWNAAAGATGYELNAWQMDEDFSDGNHSANLTWSGDTASFDVLTDGTVPDGSASTDGSFLASKGTADDSLLITPSTEVSEWRFSLGTPDVNPSDANYFGVVLMSSAAISGDIATNNFQGYYLRIGNNSTPDQIRLYRSTGAGKGHEGTFSSPAFTTGGLKDGINVRVTRDGSGVWKLWTSTGFEYGTDATNYCGSITQNSYDTSSYFGVYKHISTPDPDRRVYIDNIELGARNYVSGFEDKGTTALTEQVAGLGALADYAYMVRATNATQTSTNSNIIAVQTLTTTVTAIAATNVQSTSFFANWNDVSGDLGYLLDVFQPNEDFSDDDFTNSPAWSGDTAAFEILTDATLPDGNAATDGHYLGTKVSEGHVSLSISSTETNEWRFSVGSPDFDPSDANYVSVVLMASLQPSAGIAGSTFEGYYLKFGDGGSADQVELWRKTGAGEEIEGTFANSPDIDPGALLDGLNLKVTRDANGVFDLWYDTGFTYTNDPSTYAGAVTNTQYTGASAYFGVCADVGSPSADRRIYVDNIMLGSSLNYATGYEDGAVAADSATVQVTGLDVYADYFYRVRAVLQGGQTEESNLIYVQTDLVEPTATAATAVQSDSFTANWDALNGALGYRLDVLEMDEDFSDGDFTIGPAWGGDTGSFEILTDATVPGGNASTDGSYLACTSNTDYACLSIASTETNEWRFSLASPNFNPSTANFLAVVLMASAQPSGSLNDDANFQGYYLKIGDSGSADDHIELWRKTGASEVEVGSFITASDFDPGALRDGLNIKVTRDSAGVFNLWYSTGFTYGAEPSTYAGALTNNVYDTSSYFGVCADFNSPAATRRLYIDNITLGDRLVGYDNLSVAGTSHAVSGLSANTTYLYLLRAEFPNGTSDDSNVIITNTTGVGKPEGAMFLFR